MLAAALSTVKGNVAAARGLAKVLRAEAKRHNSAKAAAAFATAGGAHVAGGSPPRRWRAVAVDGVLLAVCGVPEAPSTMGSPLRKVLRNAAELASVIVR